MLRFILRRLLVAVPTLFVVVTVSFFMMRAAPGTPFEGQRKLSPEIEKAVNAAYGLNKPLPVQYATYLGGVLHGDFGPSLKYRDKRVIDLIAQGFPKSLTLGLSSVILASILGLGLGVVAALNQNKPLDAGATALAILGICVPGFVTAPILVLIFATTLGWLPVAGWGDFRHLLLPILVLTLPQVAVISRLTRAGMIEALRSNHIRTARAKGLSEWRVVVRHALPEAILPLITYVGPATAGVITGSLVVEKIFNLPGLGRYFVNSALQRDYTVVMGVVILYATLILVLNLVSEVIYALLDPRVKLG